MLYQKARKDFIIHVNSKRRSKENTGPMLDEDGPLANKDAKKAEAHNAFFASVLDINDRPWAVWSFELEDHNCGNLPFVDVEIVRGQSYQLNVPNSMGPWWG